ncbi:BcNRPS1, nonribosomal peptide synthetase [Amniculicola lignicola CBS 123094]|uniref:BcNRPS1, nonribosomal peptide synthetase n=1 Tax=Amniculicola lignicola CBS 123094 TaxID=1392246 RepID=A0A6A5WDL1_9PLEO|nr:BcNRPS1, nonribosomal peptide synthetase [Amniculicola lignicola CBS 123094]
MQESLIQSTNCHPGKNVIWYHEMHLPEHIPALKAAWKAVVDAEPIFRTPSRTKVGPDHNVDESADSFPWTETFVPDKVSFERELMRQDLPTDFLSSSFKVITETSAEGKSMLIWRVHHALIDGCSRDLVLVKVRRHLDGDYVGPGPPFDRFVESLKSHQDHNREAATKYWAAQQSMHSSSVSELALSRPKPALSTSLLRRVDEVTLSIDIAKLSTACQEQNITLATLFHGAWALTLTKYMDSDDVTFGTVLSGRTLPFQDIEHTVGPTFNTLPISLVVDSNLTADDFLSRVFGQLLELTHYQWTTPEHGFKRKFASAINLQLQDSSHGQSIYAPIEPPYTYLESDIPLLVDVSSFERIRLIYHTDTYFKSNIQTIANTFATALDTLINPQHSITRCLESPVTDVERKELGRLGNWGSSTTKISSYEDDLVTTFVKTASTYPHTVAIEKGGQTITYGELRTLSFMVAQRISRLIRPGDVVCVHADRSINWIVAIYAVLKAGGVYCPFIEGLPEALRDEYFIEARAKLFIGTDAASKAFCPASCAVYVSVEELLLDTPIHLEDGELEVPQSRPDRNAYLCFTSGSTGKPKGVLCKHQGLVAFQSDEQVRLHARSDWKIAQVMSPGFDGSIHEIFSALSYGATLILRSSDPFSHIKAADAVILTPSLAEVLDVKDYPKLTMVYLVGEAVSQRLSDTWSSSKILYNMYGPTEATCGATIKELKAGQPVTLGKPNPSSRIYILDSHKHLAPRGVIGEVYLAGVQVALGYIARPQQTVSKFLPDSVNSQYSERMYRTGDHAYWDENGELVLVGRHDRQIKLNGFRMDLDDLETRILQADPSCSSVALTRRDTDLVALVQPKEVDVAHVVAQLRRYLPPYAIPRYISAVESFPLTIAGKVDYKAIVSQEYVPHDIANDMSYTTNEAMIMAAIQDVLQSNEALGVHTTLQDIGMDSMVYMRLSSRLKGMFRGVCGSPQVSLYSTIRELAKWMETWDGVNHGGNGEEGTSCRELGDRNVSPIEKEWWRKYQHLGGSSVFNVSYAAELGPEVETHCLIAAWNQVLARYPIFRSLYRSDAAGLLRHYASRAPRVDEMEEINLQLEINTRFDIEDTLPVRVMISKTQMVVVVSHIICDLTTLKTLLREISQLYHGRVLLPPTKLYSQTSWDTQLKISHSQFWSEYLAGASQHTRQIGNNRKRTSWTGTSRSHHLPRTTHQSMKDLRSMYKLSMHQLALAAVGLALSSDNDPLDIVIGAPHLNRHSPEDQDVVGLFLEPLPIRIRYPPSDALSTQTSSKWSTLSLLQEVQRSSRLALSYAVPWTSLLAHLNVESPPPKHPLFDVMVTFHEKTHLPLLDIEGVEYVHTWAEGAKFELMAEFIETEGEELMLRFEYSDECFSEEDISNLERRVCKVLDGLNQGMGFDDLRLTLRE